MKTLLKIITAAAAFGLAPAAALGQPAPEPAPAAAAPAQPAGGAQPSDVSEAEPASGGERPSDAQVANTAYASELTPEVGVGQPDGRWRLQEQYSPIGQEAAWFHNWILMPAIVVITLFVLFLLLWVIVRYRRNANPVPSRNTHNTLLEVVWTLVPVLILVVIAVPSIKLLSNQYSPPAADLTIKAIGNQWRWDYEYPDHNVSFTSNVLSDEVAAQRGEPRLLAVDERIVVPVGAVVKVIVTSADVVHSFGVPSLWVKIDAVPGRLNETWFRADRPGIYYGQCFELCGARHAYMPIAVEVVPRDQFARWIASKGGSMPQAGRQPTEVRPAPQQDRVGPGDATETGPAPAGVNPGTAAAPVSRQGATNTKQGGSH
jgi:cytochrome c oxidase subunit 2